jgi:hypothetical protein
MVRNPAKVSNKEPAPGTQIVRFQQLDEGVYKGVEAKKRWRL